MAGDNCEPDLYLDVYFCIKLCRGLRLYEEIELHTKDNPSVNFFEKQIWATSSKILKEHSWYYQKERCWSSPNTKRKSIIINYQIHYPAVNECIQLFQPWLYYEILKEAWITLMKKKAIRNCNLIISYSMECVQSTKSINTIVFCLQLIYRISTLGEKISCNSWTHFLIGYLPMS